MVSLTCGMANTAQMKQNQTHRHKQQNCGGQGGVEEGNSELGLADADYYMQNG